MSRFSYKARNEKGVLITGVMDGDNRRAVYLYLDGEGLLPISVSEATSATSLNLKDFLLKYSKVSYDDLIFFTRQLQTIVKAGIPLISGLKALEEQATNPRLGNALREIYQDIDRGKTFSEALAKHPDIFPELYTSMVKAGEIGGVLEDVLQRLVGSLEFQMKTKEMFKAAMRYPIMVVSILVIAFIVLVAFVIPRFAVIFKGAKIELPLPTKIMILINDIAQNYGLLALSAIIATIVLFVLYKRSKKGRLLWDRLKLKIPIMGPILLKITVSRFANMFENMVRAGVPIIRALEIVARTVGNEYVAVVITEIGSKIEKGRGITGPLKDSGIFPPLVIRLISTGEETGSLEEMLAEVSIHYDREITYSVSRLSAWIEPILTAGLSVMVLFLALAVFLPWWNMMGAMKGGP